MYPSLKYHPLALPKPRGINLDTQTAILLENAHQLLNQTNPTLAADCWLCMPWGTPMPLAILTANISSVSSNVSSSDNCSLSLPFKVQPLSNENLTCLYQSYQNNSHDIDVGNITFANCTTNYNTSDHCFLCSNKGQVFVCGNNLAYTTLPGNWTGQFTTAILLPDINIVSGNDTIPLPSFDYLPKRHKRAVTFIPLLIGLGVTGAFATGTAGLGISLHKYNQLSLQLIDDVQAISGTL